MVSLHPARAVLVLLVLLVPPVATTHVTSTDVARLRVQV
jgi:hypothetical protein